LRYLSPVPEGVESLKFSRLLADSASALCFIVFRTPVIISPFYFLVDALLSSGRMYTDSFSCRSYYFPVFLHLRGAFDFILFWFLFYFEFYQSNPIGFIVVATLTDLDCDSSALNIRLSLWAVTLLLGRTVSLCNLCLIPRVRGSCQFASLPVSPNFGRPSMIFFPFASIKHFLRK